ncbi:YybS family protein [Gemmatimonas sp.]
MLLMVAVTAAPAWPPALALPAAAIRLLLPVEQFALVVLVAIASCAIVGWWAGGRLVLGLVWGVAAAWVVWKVPLPLSGYGAFLRGWAVTVGAAFGLVCLVAAAKPFLTRALAAVALAGVVTAGGFSVRATGGQRAFDAAALMFSQEYQQRLGASLSVWHARTASPSWRAFAARFPDTVERAERMEAVLLALADPQPASAAVGGIRLAPLVRLAPALLALESLMALALGWAAYHRLARARIGPPLAALRDLRFNDQWVWGLIVGITVLLLPTLVEWRTAGLNLVAFFGTLYALRGAGVLTWYVPDRVAVWVLLGLMVLVPVLGPVWMLVALLTVTFTLGLGDTWRDFRAGAETRRPWSP